MVILDRSVLENLVTVLKGDGYRVIGPMRRGTAIVLDDLPSAGDLPVGLGDEQRPGSYRLRPRNDAVVFGTTLSPQSWKQFLFPPTLQLVNAERSGKALEMRSPLNGQRRKDDGADEKPLAFFGMRPCDIAALAVQDRIFMGGQRVDSYYRKMRDRLLVVAANCTAAGETCFCASMGSGPRASRGYDIALTEFVREKEHYFLAESGTERGRKILDRLPHRQATPSDRQEAEKLAEQVARSMKRKLSTDNLRSIFVDAFEHPRWDQVARRCLACANCTMVCPTCFCHTIEDVTDLTGTKAERTRKWDSCFTLEFTYIHGGSVRPSTRSRYRQWLTHKLSNWTDQFGAPGCVGCGRCITWCPVGIDITEEARVILEQAYTPSTTSPQGGTSDGTS